MFCDPVHKINQYLCVTKRHLLAFLCKMRQGLSDDFLTFIFGYGSRQRTSTVIATVRQSLMLRFVPENLGLNAITRNDFIERHVTDFANQLLYITQNQMFRKLLLMLTEPTLKWTKVLIFKLRGNLTVAISVIIY